MSKTSSGLIDGNFDNIDVKDDAYIADDAEIGDDLLVRGDLTVLGTVNFPSGPASNTHFTATDATNQYRTTNTHMDFKTSGATSTYSFKTNSGLTTTSTVKSGRLQSTVATGTAPLLVASTTVVANLRAATAVQATDSFNADNATNATNADNADLLLNKSWEEPGEIGLTTRNTGAFTTLALDTALPYTEGGTGLSTVGAESTVLTILGNVPTWAPPVATDWANPGAIGSATPNTGRFTTMESPVIFNDYASLPEAVTYIWNQPEIPIAAASPPISYNFEYFKGDIKIGTNVLGSDPLPTNEEVPPDVGGNIYIQTGNFRVLGQVGFQNIVSPTFDPEPTFNGSIYVMGAQLAYLFGFHKAKVHSREQVEIVSDGNVPIVDGVFIRSATGIGFTNGGTDGIGTGGATAGLVSTSVGPIDWVTALGNVEIGTTFPTGVPYLGVEASCFFGPKARSVAQIPGINVQGVGDTIIRSGDFAGFTSVTGGYGGLSLVGRGTPLTDLIHLQVFPAYGVDIYGINNDVVIRTSSGLLDYKGAIRLQSPGNYIGLTGKAVVFAQSLEERISQYGADGVYTYGGYVNTPVGSPNVTYASGAIEFNTGYYCQELVTGDAITVTGQGAPVDPPALIVPPPSDTVIRLNSASTIQLSSATTTFVQCNLAGAFDSTVAAFNSPLIDVLQKTKLQFGVANTPGNGVEFRFTWAGDDSAANLLALGWVDKSPEFLFNRSGDFSAPQSIAANNGSKPVKLTSLEPVSVGSAITYDGTSHATLSDQTIFNNNRGAITPGTGGFEWNQFNTDIGFENNLMSLDTDGNLTVMGTVTGNGLNWESPGQIGLTVPNTGAFTTLTTTSSDPVQVINETVGDNVALMVLATAMAGTIPSPQFTEIITGAANQVGNGASLRFTESGDNVVENKFEIGIVGYQSVLEMTNSLLFVHNITTITVPDLTSKIVQYNLQPNLDDGAYTAINLGVDSSTTNDAADIRFHFVATTDSSNYLGLGLIDSPDIVKVFDDHVDIQGTFFLNQGLNATELNVTNTGTVSNIGLTVSTPLLGAGEFNAVVIGISNTDKNAGVLEFNRESPIVSGLDNYFRVGLAGYANIDCYYDRTLLPMATTILSDTFFTKSAPSPQGSYLAHNTTSLASLNGQTVFSIVRGGGTGGYEFNQYETGGSGGINLYSVNGSGLLTIPESSGGLTVVGPTTLGTITASTSTTIPTFTNSGVVSNIAMLLNTPTLPASGFTSIILGISNTSKMAANMSFQQESPIASGNFNFMEVGLAGFPAMAFFYDNIIAALPMITENVFMNHTENTLSVSATAADSNTVATFFSTNQPISEWSRIAIGKADTQGDSGQIVYFHEGTDDDTSVLEIGFSGETAQISMTGAGATNIVDINGPIGFGTPNTGDFTTLTTSGISDLTGDTALKGAGLIGEFEGSAHAGTNGTAYFNSTTTAFVTVLVDTVLATVTLGEGLYQVSTWWAWKNNGAAVAAYQFHVNVGGTQVTPRYWVECASADHRHGTCGSFPVRITGGSVAVDLVGVDNKVILTNLSEVQWNISAFRIA